MSQGYHKQEVALFFDLFVPKFLYMYLPFLRIISPLHVKEADESTLVSTP